MEETIIDQCIRNKVRGIPTFPDAIQNAPILEIGLELFFTAFFNLSSCRQIGQHGVQGPIPWMAVNDYCHRMELSDEQSHDMFYYVGDMDSAFLKHYSEKG